MGIIKRIFGKKTPPPSTTDGKVYGSDFVGPLRPQDIQVDVPDETLNRDTQQSVVPTPPKPNGGGTSYVPPVTSTTVKTSNDILTQKSNLLTQNNNQQQSRLSQRDLRNTNRYVTTEANSRNQLYNKLNQPTI